MLAKPGDLRSPGLAVTGFVVVTVVFGLVGACLAGWVLLMLSPRPSSARGQAWRSVALTTLTTGIVAGAVGGGIGLVLGLAHPSTAFFAFWEGSILAGLPGLLLGFVAGSS